MTKHKLIYIEWEDAIANHGWHDTKQMADWAKDSSTLIKQVAWVYGETEEYLILYSRCSMDRPEEETYYGNLQKIPKTWIRKTVNLTKHI